MKLLFDLGENLTEHDFHRAEISVVDFVGGQFGFRIFRSVFAPIYLFAMNYFGIIEEGEKEKIKSVINV